MRSSFTKIELKILFFQAKAYVPCQFVAGLVQLGLKTGFSKFEFCNRIAPSEDMGIMLLYIFLHEFQWYVIEVTVIIDVFHELVPISIGLL